MTILAYALQDRQSGPGDKNKCELMDGSVSEYEWSAGKKEDGPANIISPNPSPALEAKFEYIGKGYVLNGDGTKYISGGIMHFWRYKNV